MIPRHAIWLLRDWFLTKPRKPLFLRGARQVGKSTAVRQLAETLGLELLEVNLELASSLRPAFATLDPQTILSEIGFLLKRGGSTPDEKTVLFLDEVQAIPSAIQSLRYFYEKFPNIAVIAAGSLVEFALEDAQMSMPVGRVEYLYLQQLSFEEFLVALDETDLVDLMNSYSLGAPFPATAHDRLCARLRTFLLVGGMPEAIDTFVRTKDLDATRKVQINLINTYREDFNKYCKRQDLVDLQTIFDRLPAIVGDKIKFSKLLPDARAAKAKYLLDLLFKSQVALKVSHAAGNGVPFEEDSKVFKSYLLDCGLLGNLNELQELPTERMLELIFTNEGRLAEQFIAQHLIGLKPLGQRPTLNYWLREGKKNNAEVDFLISIAGRIVPIEVKAGETGRLRSLLQFAQEKDSKVAVRFDANLPSLQYLNFRPNSERESAPPSHAVSSEASEQTKHCTVISLPLYLVQQTNRLVREFE